MIDSSMLPDFIVEAAEHLEEMESSLLRLEQDYEDKEVMDEIFRSIHTIKGAAQFVGIERVSELSHKMENLLDLIRRHEITLNTAITDLLIAGKDRIALLVDELERNRAEESEVADLVEQIRRVVEGDVETVDMGSFDDEDTDEEEPHDEVGGRQGLLAEENMSDEYDEELYNIFLQQLKENIPFLYAQTVELSISVDKQDVLYRCSDSIKSLKSSANYMGYEKLTQHYSNWQHAIENAVEQLSGGKMPNLSFMQDYLDEIIRSFPQAMDGYSQDDTDMLGDGLRGEKQDALSIDSALNSIFSDDDEPIASSDGSAAVHDGHEQVYEDTDEPEPQGIDLDQALDSIFSDELSVNEEPEDDEDDDSDVLSLDGAVPGLETSATSGTPGMNGRSSSRETGGADTVPLEYELSGDEYDEELVSIFLKKLSADINYIQETITEYQAGGDKKTLLEQCHDAIGRLASSANYMEYISLTEFCETWQNVVDGYLADIAEGTASDVTSGMQEFVDRIISVYPRIAEDNQHTEGADAGKDDDRVDSISSVAEEMLSASVSAEKKGTAAEAGTEKKTAEESDTHAKHAADEQAEDKTLFDKLSNALDMSEEYASGSSADSIDSVIEEIMDTPDQGDGYSEEGDADPVLSLSRLSEETAGETAGTKNNEHLQKNQKSAAQLADMVAASGSRKKSEPAISDDKVDKEDGTKDDIDVQEDSVRELVTEKAAEKESDNEQDEKVSAASATDFGQSENPQQKERQEQQDDGEQRSGKKAVRSSIRVDAEKIDYLMNQVGELVVSRAYFAQLVNEMRGLEQQLLESSGISKTQLKPLHEFSFRLSEAGVHLGRVSNELQEGVMKVRMLPIDQLFKRYPRLVRDLVHNTDKDVKLITKGEDTELDKMVIESISDPLIHIIRNSVDHGIETVEERLRAGKPAQGALVLEAFHESDHIVLEITDDGRGIDAQRIRAKALEKGIVRKEELERMSDQELTRLIMLPGFSTAEKATKTSGRGVGMDVVKKNIEKLNGTVEIVSEKGKGTRLRIKIPLTMAIIQALMVRVGQEKFTIPLTTVEETLRVFRHEISEIEGVNVIHLRENTMPIFQLAKIYNIDRQGQDEEKMFVVVVSTGTQELGLVVDELLGQEEVVIKPLADYLRVESGFGGATILGDGGISLILDIPELVKIAKENQAFRQEQRTFSFKRKKSGAAGTAQPVH